MAETNDGSRKSGWVHCLGRVVVWLVGAALGAVFGGVTAGVMDGGALPVVALDVAVGLSVVATMLDSSLPVGIRDMLGGIGLGVIGGSGFAVYLFGHLPSC